MWLYKSGNRFSAVTLLCGPTQSSVVAVEEGLYANQMLAMRTACATSFEQTTPHLQVAARSDEVARTSADNISG
jgi:hypothetical protein